MEIRNDLELFPACSVYVRSSEGHRQLAVMSRPRRGLQLPHALQQELGLESSLHNKHKNGVQNRKDQRKSHRVEKRQQNRGSNRNVAPRVRNQRVDERQHDLDDNVPAGRSDQDSRPRSIGPVPRRHTPKSILKKPAPPSPVAGEASAASEEEADEADGYERLYRGDTPEIVLDATSRSYKDNQAEDDDEIAALEKRLGLKGRKKGSNDDGLLDLLGEDNEEQNDSKKRRSEEDDWLKSKRRKAEAASRPAAQAVNEAAGGESQGENDSASNLSDDVLNGEDMEGSDGFAGFESDDDDDVGSHKEPPPRVRENPYMPPVTAPSTTKYVPPSLRKSQGTDDEVTTRLRRQLQGHLNKLSEANLISILSSIESVYRTNARGSVTDILVDLLLSLFSSPTSLSNTFSILHGAFAAAVYRVMGIDFGAALLSSLVDRFFSYHTTDVATKEPLNLISLVSNLFTFNVVASPLIYSFIRQLLAPLTESNTELLLRLIRDCGPQLRLDDPSALKTIVSLTQKAAYEMEAREGHLSVRTKFMLETIVDLKNNKIRASTADVGATKEHITRMRKALGSLSNRNLRATEPLRIDLNDIRNSDRKGKWWLVGASWKGHDPTSSHDLDHTDHTTTASTDSSLDDHLLPQEPDYASLARHLRLTTPLAISIFTAIASSPSATQAHERLLKLNLKAAQIPEIPRVLLRCCAAEPSYNPFYDVLAKRLCSLGDKARRIAKGLDFACWGFMRRVGVAGGDEDGGGDMADIDEEGEGSLQMHELHNVANLYAALVVDGAVSLGVLRVVDLHTLKPDSVGQLWVELLLVRILVLCNGEQKDVKTVFGRLVAARQVVPRLKVFGRQWVKGSQLVDEKERKVVKKGWKVAEDVLQGLLGGGDA